MYGLYSHRSDCLSYQVHLYVCPNIYLCVALTLASTLGDFDVKGLLYHNSTKPFAPLNFTWYTRVYYIIPVWMY